ncbi:MAG: enoyl-CoA hydratase/isomerase family protein [Halococcoides sp.]
MDRETIRTEIADRIGTITLDRPDRMNALDPSMLDELGAAIERFGDDPDVRAITIDGAGRAFCAGADVDRVILDPDAHAATAIARRGQATFEAIETCPTPVIAAIDGVALGGGMELAAAADLRIATPEARFGQPEITLGILPCWGGTQRLTRIVGEGRAREIVLTGEQYSAEEMAEMGFLLDVIADLPAERRRLAEHLAAGPPLAQAAAKRAIRAGRSDVAAGLEIEAQAFGRLAASADAARGVEAFLNDDEPSFTGE